MAASNSTPTPLQQAAAALQARGAALRARPGVVHVRVGYKIENNWPTTTPALVVTVLPKKAGDATAPGEGLPAQVDGVPVETRLATPMEQLAASGTVPPPTVLTVAANEPRLDTGLPHGGETAAAGMDLDHGLAAAAGGFSAEAVEAARVPPLPYTQPDGLPLDILEVTTPMAVLCHCGPDAAWPTLKPFLEGTTDRLTVAMYELTAPHIKEAIQNVIASPRKLAMVLDPGADPLASGDEKEVDVVDDLHGDLGARFSTAWALVSKGGKVTAAIFPSAYHIKVAVRDGTAFWLSSGNWKSSNQAGDLFDPQAVASGQAPPPAGLMANHDRDWHVIVEEPGLASLFEKYIRHDLEIAAAHQASPDGGGVGILGVDTEALPDVFVPAAAAASTHTGAGSFFAPQRFPAAGTAPLQVRPLLTPDNFAKHVKEVIDQAQTRLYIQNQYIKPRDTGDIFSELVKAVADKIAAGLDVRIILRDLGSRASHDTTVMLESLQAHGIDLSKVKLQTGCHNKGVIADGKVVVLGSHNWSHDGVVDNRDASLIFFDPGIAQYYEKIFLDDWTHRAKQQLPSATDSTSILALPGVEQPPGTVRVPWNEAFTT